MTGAATMKARLAAGETLVGAFANLGSAMAVEALGVAGMDWVVIDLEHGGGHEAALLGQIHGAIAGGLHPLVRVESLERPRAGRALDLGAEGIMFPRVDGPGDARTALAGMRYGPDGERGVATYNRACAFGTRPEAIDEAAGRVLGVVQIESPAAVEAAEAIADTDGVDTLFVGPGDLSHAMGIRGQLGHPDFRAAIEHVVTVAEAAGKAAGILVGRPDQVVAAAVDGFRMIGVGSDSTLLVQAASAAVEAAHALRAPR
jgi:2-keto-3-deoxy-L-rhamnonate aldolase RhmA